MLVMEECGELIQACSKTEHPDLQDEVGDVGDPIEIMKTVGIENKLQIEWKKRNKNL